MLTLFFGIPALFCRKKYSADARIVSVLICVAADVLIFYSCYN